MTNTTRGQSAIDFAFAVALLVIVVSVVLFQLPQILAITEQLRGPPEQPVADKIIIELVNMSSTNTNDLTLTEQELTTFTTPASSGDPPPLEQRISVDQAFDWQIQLRTRDTVEATYGDTIDPEIRSSVSQTVTARVIGQTTDCNAGCELVVQVAF